MENITLEQKNMLLYWAKTCKEKNSLEIYFDLFWYLDDKEAFIECNNRKIQISYDSKEQCLNVLHYLSSNAIVKLACPPRVNHVLRDFLFGFVSMEAIESLVTELTK